MSKSKKQTKFEKINTLADTYRKLSDQQLINYLNSPFKGVNKENTAAVKNEIKRRGLKIDYLVVSSNTYIVT
jgi:hypothetical protein